MIKRLISEEDASTIKAAAFFIENYLNDSYDSPDGNVYDLMDIQATLPNKLRAIAKKDSAFKEPKEIHPFTQGEIDLILAALDKNYDFISLSKAKKREFISLMKSSLISNNSGLIENVCPRCVGSGRNIPVNKVKKE